jgi:hypothetical protein
MLMRDSWKKPLTLTGMLLLLIVNVIVIGVLAVFGFTRFPYIAIPIFVALIVWGLVRVYNALLRQAEAAYWERRKASQRARAEQVGQAGSANRVAGQRDPDGDA